MGRPGTSIDSSLRSMGRAAIGCGFNEAGGEPPSLDAGVGDPAGWWERRSFTLGWSRARWDSSSRASSLGPPLRPTESVEARRDSSTSCRTQDRHRHYVQCDRQRFRRDGFVRNPVCERAPCDQRNQRNGSGRPRPSPQATQNSAQVPFELSVEDCQGTTPARRSSGTQRCNHRTEATMSSTAAECRRCAPLTW
jgi:hypothetical protein